MEDPLIYPFGIRIDQIKTVIIDDLGDGVFVFNMHPSGNKFIFSDTGIEPTPDNPDEAVDIGYILYAWAEARRVYRDKEK